MKKVLVIFALVFSTSCFADNYNELWASNVEKAITTISRYFDHGMPGDVYGKVSEDKNGVLLNTPIGEITAKKENGGYRLFGCWAKLVSAKNGVYVVDTSCGKFSIDTKKMTVTKIDI